MKHYNILKTFAVAAAIVLIPCAISAQRKDAREQAAADWRKMAGMEGPHRF